MREVDLMPQVEAAVEQCVRSIPFVRVDNVHRELSKGSLPRADLVVDLSVGQPGADAHPAYTFIVEFKTNGHPGVARSAVAELQHYAYAARREDPQGRHVVPVFAAPFITKETARICAESGVGYLDLAGNCRISFDTVYIEKTGNPNQFARQENRKSLFTPKAERLLRVLLQESGRSWKLQDLARAAEVSLGTASEVKARLHDREWVVSDRSGIRLARPQSLLDAWKRAYDFDRNQVHSYFSLKTPRETEAAIADACRDLNYRCAFTEFSGAARYAPFVRYNRVSAYVTLAHPIRATKWLTSADGLSGTVPEGYRDQYLARVAAEKVATSMELKPVSSGANVTLLTPYDEGVLFDCREVDGEMVASPLQTYLDLQHVRARGEEAAEHLYQTEIEARWSDQDV
jgi:hypothetical protein